jgi:hypothetical protein
MGENAKIYGYNHSRYIQKYYIPKEARENGQK